MLKMDQAERITALQLKMLLMRLKATKTNIPASFSAGFTKKNMNKKKEKLKN